MKSSSLARMRTISLCLMLFVSSSHASQLSSSTGLKATSASEKPAEGFTVQGQNLVIQFDSQMRSRISGRFQDKTIALTSFSDAETLQGFGHNWEHFTLASHSEEKISDSFGAGQRFTSTGTSGPVTKTVSITLYDQFPGLAVFDVTYTNTGRANLLVHGWTNNSYTIAAQTPSTQPAFWSYQTGSYERRPDWIVPLKTGFSQDNFQGMNASDYGGGTPIADVWRKDIGLAIGHLDPKPRLVSLPVSMPDATHARVAITYHHRQPLAPGESLHTLRTFVSVHQGDYFRTLLAYRQYMTKQGFEMAKSPDSAFQPIWCAWGYNRKFTASQIFGTLPTVKKLGFAWVTLDDGWQNNYGDWQVDPKKFPRGDADMKALVDKIHQQGFLAQLWWSPLSAVPSSELLKDHPDYALENRDGSPRKISWWNSEYLCPADRDVVDYHKALVRKILGEWGFDGLKLDGQFMNGIPACYNPAHHHARPEDSVEALPDFFHELYETAKSVKPNALVEFCPCGTSFSFFNMPNYNMSVASDPESSFQVRSKGKTLKGLMGDDVAYFGDHVELSDNHDDFASTVGVGGVIGTQFVLPALAVKRTIFDLSPAREKQFAKWLAIYQDKMLSRGQYLGELYDIGFDRPEAHAIRKETPGNAPTMYYAFFAPRWDGSLELRGLEDRTYQVTDYENGKDLGAVKGPTAWLTARFAKHLMLEAKPQ